MNDTLARGTDEIHALFGNLTSSPASHFLLDLSLATATSIRLSVAEGTEPVWLLIVGAPSTGKTQSVLPMKDHPHTVFLDTLTPEAFISGFRDNSGTRATNLLAELNHKCLIVKDLTTLFSLRGDKIKKVLGDLQSIFDGEFSKAVGTSTDPTTSIIRSPSKFSFIGCITRQAFERHQRYLSIIGSRFLVARLPKLTPEEEALGFERAANPKPDVDRELRKLVRRHIDAVGDGASKVTISPEQDQTLKQVSRFVARGRTPVAWDVAYDPGDDGESPGRIKKERVLGDPEGPFRAYRQCRVLLRALASLRGRDCPTKEDMGAIRQVALSTILAARADILDCLRAAPVTHVVDGATKRGLTATAVSQHTRLSDDQARNRLEDMAGVGLFVKTIIEGEEVGNLKVREGFYYPAPDFEPLLLPETEETYHEHTPSKGVQVSSVVVPPAA